MGVLAFDRSCEAFCALLIIAEVCILPFLHNREGLMVGVDMLRTLLTLLVIWISLLYMQTIPGMGRIVVLIRELVLDLFMFVFIFTFCISLFSRTFMLFFGVNSQQGCVEDFSSYGKAAYNLYRAMLNMVDFTQYDVIDRPMLFINHFMFASIVGILMVNILIAVFTNTIDLSQAGVNSDVVTTITLLLKVLNIHVLLSHLPLVNRLYHYYYAARLRRCFVCEGSRVLLFSKTTRKKGSLKCSGRREDGKEGQNVETCLDDISEIILEENFGISEAIKDEDNAKEGVIEM